MAGVARILPFQTRLERNMALGANGGMLNILLCPACGTERVSPEAVQLPCHYAESVVMTGFFDPLSERVVRFPVGVIVGLSAEPVEESCPTV